MVCSVFDVLTLSCGVCGLDVHREVAGDGEELVV